MTKEEKVSRRGYVKYAGAGIVVVAVAGAGAYYATRPGPTPMPTETPTEKPTVTPTEKPTPTGIVVEGATPKERALNAARQYVQMHDIPEGTELVMTYPSGGAGHFQPKYWKEFEDACMGKVKIRAVEITHTEIRGKFVAEGVEKSGAYDILQLTPYSHHPDYDEMGLFAQLDDWVAKYDPEFDHGPCPYPPAINKMVNQYKGHWYGAHYDYDVWLMVYNADLFEDPNEKESFESEFGYPLRSPLNWQEFEDMSNFFYRPDEGMYGTWSYKVVFWDLFEWKQRLTSRGVPFFDDEMRPLIHTAPAIEATKDMLSAYEYQPEEAKTAIWDTAYGFFAEGKLAFLISWTSLLKFATGQGIRCKAALNPGYPTKDGRIRHAGFLAGSQLLAVNSYSKHPELAYLLFQFYTDPQQSAWVVCDPAGFNEPHRVCHFSDPQILEVYAGGDQSILDMMYDNMINYVVPDIILKGAGDYDDALDRHLNGIIKGGEKPEDGLKAVAEEWEEITDRIGRDSQIEAWLALKDGYGDKIKPLMDPDL